MKPRSSRIPLITSALFAAFTLTPAAYAVNAAWNTDAATGDFGSPNWTSGTTTPAAGGTYTVVSNDALFFGTSSTTNLNNDLSGANFNGLTFNSGASAFIIGGNSFTLNGNITNNSSSLQTINNAMTFGARTFSGGAGGLALGGTLTSTGSMTVNSGSVTLSGASTIDGGAANNNGFLTVLGNTTLTVASGGSLSLLGTTGGTKPNSIVGQNAAGTSTLLVNGGSLSIGGNTGFVLGNNVNTATGALTVSSGTARITAGSAVIGNMQNFISLGRDNAHGVINLDGGTLATGRQFVRDGSGGGTVGSGTATFNFNGGVLQAQADQTSGNGWFETATTGNFQVVTTTVKAGGAKIDTNGFNTNINTNLAHDSGLGATADGGLTKSGTGTLTLGNANTYTGATTISGGTLALGAAGSIDNTSGVSLGTNGTFDVSAKSGYTVNNLIGSGSVIGSLTVSTQLAIGNSPGAVNFSSDLTLGSGSTYLYEMVGGGTEADLGDVAGSLTLTGSTLDLVQLGTYTVGDKFTLFAYDGTLTGTFNGLADDSTFTDAGGDWLIDYNDSVAGLNGGTGTNYVTITAIPEPGAALLGGLGLLALLRRRRN